MIKFLKCLTDDLSSITHHVTAHRKIIKIINDCMIDMDMINNTIKCISLTIQSGCNKDIKFKIGDNNKLIPNIISINKNVKFLGMILPNYLQKNKA